MGGGWERLLLPLKWAVCEVAFIGELRCDTLGSQKLRVPTPNRLDEIRAKVMYERVCAGIYIIAEHDMNTID